VASDLDGFGLLELGYDPSTAVVALVLAKHPLNGGQLIFFDWRIPVSKSLNEAVIAAATPFKQLTKHFYRIINCQNSYQLITGL
jgi:hypothetical protein